MSVLAAEYHKKSTMSLVDQMTLERAYRILGLPIDASANAIKQAHRKLVKRWHPDLYKEGTTEHSAATEMTRLTNDAYSTVSHAPLRYQRGFASYGNPARTTYTPRSEPATSEISGPRLDRIEFWARFFCGAILGLFIALDASGLILEISMDVSMKLWLVGLILSMVGFGFLAARMGDKFWYSLMEKWFD
jgi:hypothetical protein